MLDVAVHVGTLLAVIAYFWKDLWQMASHVHQPNSDGFHMLRNVVIASVPVILIGFILNKLEPSFLCMIEIMAWMMLIFGIVLWVADKIGKTDKKLESMTSLQAFWIGLSQSIALIPGTSRSGITMTTARFLGFNRVDAARFSLLLSIIAIAGAGALNTVSVIKAGDLELGLSVGLAVLLSFVTGWVSIIVMMKWLKHFSFTPFAIYRVILGCVLLYFIYSGNF